MNSNRRLEVQKFIEANGEVSLETLQALYPDLSGMTLRRDLIFLEEQGFIKRTRGGAIALTRTLTGTESRFSFRANEHSAAKAYICSLALPLLEVGRSIFIDSGSTMMTLARMLPDEHFTFITSGPNIALELVKQPKHIVIVIGGHLNPTTLSSSGSQSLSFLSDINIDIAVMSTSGFSLNSGFSSGSPTECELKRALIKKARKAIMLMDLSKANKSMPFTFANLEDIDALICDSIPGDDIVEACVSKQVDIIY